MNIMMVTNTYLPHVGGVALSVDRFTKSYRARGHRVLVACPEFEGQPKHEEDVMRIHAIQKFNGSDFSLSYPTVLSDAKDDFNFEPDIIHSHHPYFLGDAALRVSAAKNVPLIFTYHTMYEQYTHYVPGDSPVMRRFVIELSSGYANMCDCVIAPSESIADLIRGRGVKRPIRIVPTGVDLRRFASGDGCAVRDKYGIPGDAYLVGHLGRLAPEKNLDFLSNAVGKFLQHDAGAHFLVVGYGTSQEEMRSAFQEMGVAERVHFTGKLVDGDVVDAYHAMDVFAFASKSETQGMVIAEAMAAGLPVVALNASGVREVVRDGRNGRLVDEEEVNAFAQALEWVRTRTAPELKCVLDEVRTTAGDFSCERLAEKGLRVYESVLENERYDIAFEATEWELIQNTIEREWNLWANRLTAAAQAFVPKQDAARGELEDHFA